MPEAPDRGRADRGLVTTDVGVAVGRLREGGLVAVPTETVYGLAADAENPSAVARIFEIKGRPAGHPLIVHLGDADQLAGWARSIPRSARVLIRSCWPGPLTVLLERGPRVLDVITGGRPAVAIRVPSHPMTRELLARFGGGVAAPSANRFGRVSPTTAAHVVDDLGALLDPARDVILDGGPTPVGVESTIVDCTVEPPQILRPGGIPTEDIVRLLDGDVSAAAGPARASGMLEAHYAPRCEVRLAESLEQAEQIVAGLRLTGLHADVLDHGDDLVDAARNLYGELRRADELALDVLVAVLPPARGLGHAIRDRLTKAAKGSTRAGPNRGD
ncbi:MAG TPA: L-threonylcarbamoyladenylate synthase [Ilumatobacteraceae bacterium]|nr:L-threonylcarbamoyladenylate synthase [Ilumatobacteraceae bacterium]